ncbi:unnamed protein product [Rotaria sordida]|uniref:Cullin family profile domain-containing protein n=1 Tax=Rotaria sordida TaxID=392033 RepID=A0A819KRG1_9BILA|nr:unnamed protein product [Rotaria sordida]
MYNVAANDTSNEILIKLFHDIDRIFSYQTCDVNSVIELYTRVYNYCTSASARLAEFRLLETATGRRKYLLQATYFSYGMAIDFPHKMFIWLNDEEITVLNEKLYENYFEKPFLQNTEEFYRSKAIFDLENISVIEYLEKFTPYINKDMELIYSYLPSSTQKQLIKLIYEIFLKDHLDIIQNHIDKLIHEENIQDLDMIYKIVKQIPIIKNQIIEIIENYFYQTGIKTIEYLRETANNDLNVYIETIFDIRKKFLILIQQASNDEQSFTTALNKFCSQFIYYNRMTYIANDIKLSLDLLVKYFDTILIKGNKSIEKINLEKFNQIMIFLNYIEDENFLENFYKEILRKLLFDQLTISNNNKESIVSLESDSEDILRFYKNLWDKYEISSKTISQKKTMNEISIMAIKIWQKYVFHRLNKQIIKACLDLIKCERNNEVINTHLIGRVIQSYVTLGFGEDTKTNTNNNNDNNNRMTSPALTIYKDYFEIEFLKDTEEFYRLESVTFLVNNSVTEYLKKVAQRLDEEVHRTQSYLHSSTLQILIENLEEILIHDQIQLIYAEAKILLHSESHQDLALLFRLVNRIPNVTIELNKIVENHIYNMGINTIEHVSETAINDPRVYIETIIDIHKKFLKLIQNAFNNEKSFTTALDTACSKFINNNTITQTAGITTKSSELLARYCDVLLRRGNKTVEETDLEEKFNEIMVVLNYIEDKDHFLKLYQKLLSKRLLHQLIILNEYEGLIISKLKQIYTYEYTTTVERMYQDIIISKTLMSEYEKFCKNPHLTDLVNFSAIILNSKSWPFLIPSNLILPIELKSTFNSFIDFYTDLHHRRKLTWVHQHSKGELQTFFTSQKYTLQVSIYQMVILLLFNKTLNWKVKQIQDETQIKSELLRQILSGLLKSKILICKEISEDEYLNDSDIKENYSIRLATDFISFYFKPEVCLIKKCIDILIEKEYLKRDSNENDVLHYLN